MNPFDKSKFIKISLETDAKEVWARFSCHRPLNFQYSSRFALYSGPRLFKDDNKPTHYEISDLYYKQFTEGAWFPECVEHV